MPGRPPPSPATRAVHTMIISSSNTRCSEKLFVYTTASQFDSPLLNHSVLHFDSDADLPFLMYFVTQPSVLQLPTAKTHHYSQRRRHFLHHWNYITDTTTEMCTCQLGRLVCRPGGPPHQMVGQTSYPVNRGRVVMEGREWSNGQSHKEDGVEQGRDR